VTSYVILIENTPDGGFGAWAPDLPGCVALGDSFEECLAEMRTAVAFHLEGLREDGLPIPAPSTRAALVDAA
jgi:predicted RNase H-like HicB family nuclease